MKNWSALIGLLASFATGQVFADAIITSAEREIIASVGGVGSFLTNISTTGVFVATVDQNPGGNPEASADQDSSIGVLQFEGEGSGNIDGSTAAAAGASSTYEVFFDLSASHAYSLSITLAVLEDGGDGSAEFLLSGPTTNINPITGLGTFTFSISGVLGPGSYELALEALSTGTQGSNFFVTTTWDFDLTLRVLQVPEPTTLALLGIALAGLGFSRRTRS